MEKQVQDFGYILFNTMTLTALLQYTSMVTSDDMVVT